MSFEEEFDKIMREKVDEAAFPFDEKNWAKLSKQLDHQRKPAGFFKARHLYVAAALLLLLSSLFYFNREKLVEQKNDLSQSSTLVEDHSLPGKNTVAPASNENAVAPASPDRPASAQSTPGEAAVKNVQEFKADQSAGKTELNMKQRNRHNQVTAKAVPAIDRPLPRTETTSAGQVPETVMPAKETALKVETPSAFSQNAQPASGMHSNTGTGEGVSDQEQTKALNATEEIFETVYLNSLVTALPQEAVERELIPTKFVTFKYFDEDYFKKKKHKIHYMNLEAGTTYLLGWQVKNGTDGKGFNWFGGVNYGLYLSKKLSLSLGAQVYNIANIEQPFYNHTKIEYGFGSVSSTTVITAHSLYYAAVPLKITCAINPQNQVGLGFNMGFMMNAKNDVESYSLSENGKTDIMAAKKKGLYEGMSTTNMMVSAFYRTQVAKRLSLNGEFIYGLTDIFENTKTIKNNENALGFRLSLQYTLFDK